MIPYLIRNLWVFTTEEHNFQQRKLFVSHIFLAASENSVAYLIQESLLRWLSGADDGAQLEVIEPLPREGCNGGKT